MIAKQNDVWMIVEEKNEENALMVSAHARMGGLVRIAHG